MAPPPHRVGCRKAKRRRTVGHARCHAASPRAGRGGVVVVGGGAVVVGGGAVGVNELVAQGADQVEAQLHEEGLENRWYTAKVLGVPADGVVKVRFDELLENEGAGKLVQVVPVADVRPEPPDETEEVRKAAWLEALHDGTLCEAYKDDAWWPSIVRLVPSSRRGQATVRVDFQGFESDVRNETGWRNATLSLAEIRPRWGAAEAATGRWAVEHDWSFDN